ncbi:MAG: NnrS family protein, partial [Isosphaeraceae bacterium]
GFAQNTIYGFGQKLLPGFLRGGSTRRGFFEISWIAHNAGVLVLCLARLADFKGKAWVGSVSIVVGALLFVIALRGLFQRRQVASRPEAGHRLLPRYIQVAFCWLLIGLAMLAAGDLAEAVRGVAPPHPYLGALRHALTVGFMTTLILGVGQRLVPILEHRLLTWPALVAPIFLLIAVGNALRVATELATLIWPPAFLIMPISSVLELTALSLFAANILRTLWPPVEPWKRTGQVTPQTHVANLLAEHPWLEDHLISWGLHYLGRVRAVPNELTLGSLIKGEGFEIDDVVGRINALMGKHKIFTA